MAPAAKLLRERHSTREFDATRPITLAELSQFLDGTARVLGTFSTTSTSGGGPAFTYAVRPYPSGGSSYELELYLAVDKCEGLPRGFYHYDAGEHGLVPIDVPMPEFEALLKGAEFAMDASGVPQILIIIAARFGRVSWKYSSIAYCAYSQGHRRLDADALSDGDRYGARRLRHRQHHIELFAKLTGLEFHVEGPVGLFALGRGEATDCLRLITSPRPAAAARVGRIARCGALEISDRFACPRAHQREHGVLRDRRRARSSRRALQPGPR